MRLLHYELLLAPFLDVGDICEGRLRGQVDRDDGYRGHPDHVHGYRPVGARTAEQRDGNERRDTATDYRRQLVADRGPAVADARAEELGEEARLGAYIAPCPITSDSTMASQTRIVTLVFMSQK